MRKEKKARKGKQKDKKRPMGEKEKMSQSHKTRNQETRKQKTVGIFLLQVKPRIILCCLYTPCLGVTRSSTTRRSPGTAAASQRSGRSTSTVSTTPRAPRVVDHAQGHHEQSTTPRGTTSSRPRPGAPRIDNHAQGHHEQTTTPRSTTSSQPRLLVLPKNTRELLCYRTLASSFIIHHTHFGTCKLQITLKFKVYCPQYKEKINRFA